MPSVVEPTCIWGHLKAQHWQDYIDRRGNIRGNCRACRREQSGSRTHWDDRVCRTARHPKTPATWQYKWGRWRCMVCYRAARARRRDLERRRAA